MEPINLSSIEDLYAKFKAAEAGRISALENGEALNADLQDQIALTKKAEAERDALREKLSTAHAFILGLPGKLGMNYGAVAKCRRLVDEYIANATAHGEES